MPQDHALYSRSPLLYLQLRWVLVQKLKYRLRMQSSLAYYNKTSLQGSIRQSQRYPDRMEYHPLFGYKLMNLGIVPY